MEQFIQENIWLLILIGLWSIPWKGVALWKAARRGDTQWFIFLLIVNTVAILDIIYIFKFSKRPSFGENSRDQQN